MKISAFILLASFIAFVVETIKLPFPIIANKKAETQSCCKAKSACEQACTPGKSQRSKQDDCNNSTKCIDCPLCFVFASQQLKGVSPQTIYIMREYPGLQIFALADYFSQQWKPPRPGKNIS